MAVDTTFNFCPKSLVPETLHREAPTVMTMGGWTFSAKPTTPHQKKFRVMLHGLRWYLNNDGTYDATTEVTTNAKALEEFYEAHETWRPFNWVHPHLGSIVCRFAAPVNIGAAISNSGGFLDPVEITLIHHNPGY